MNTGLDALRSSLQKHWQAGAPWLARDALDAMATLDLPAWAVLLALIDECPVLHAGVGASKDSRRLSVSATDFEFISENSQIASVREFMQSLPEILRRSSETARRTLGLRNSGGIGAAPHASAPRKGD